MPRPLKSTARAWSQSKGPDTRWRDRKRVTLPDGTRKEVFGYGTTKQAATEELYRKVEALTQSQPSAETITVTALFAEFIQHKRSVKGGKAKTIHDHLGLFTRHVQPAIGSKPLAEVTLSDLQGLQHRLTSTGRWRTAELLTIQLKSLLAFAAKRYRSELASARLHLVSRDDLDSIKRPQGATRAVGELWTREQVAAFLELSRRRYLSQPKSTLYPVFYTALAAGLRRGELLGLGRHALKQITLKGKAQYYLDITEQLVDYGGTLHRETPKTSAGVRRVPISTGHARALHAHLDRMDELAERQERPPSPLMFPSSHGTPLTARTLYRGLETLTKDLNLPHSTLHQLRKVYTSYLTRDLVRDGRYSPKLVQARLGHNTPGVALEVYTLLIDEDYMGAFFDPETPAAGIGAGAAPKEKDGEN